MHWNYISVPYEYEQGELYGNKYEKHLQLDINDSYMKKHYTYLKLIDRTICASGHEIATYHWKNEGL